MKTVSELKEERAAFINEAEGILDAAEAESRELSPEEKAKYDTSVAKVESLNDDIERRMKLEKAAKPTFEPQHPTARLQPSPNPDDTEIEAPQAVIRPDGSRGPRVEIPRSYGKLVAFDKTPKGELSAYRAGMWIYATLYGNIHAKDWCRKNGVGPRAALEEGSNTSGGALVPDELERAIIDLREQYGLFRRVCRVTPMGSDTLTIPRRVGGVTAYYAGEGGSVTESDASWDSVKLTAKKLMVLTRMSSEVAEDAIIDLADTLAQEIAYAFAIKEDTVGFTGTGIGTDGGIVGVFVQALDAAHTLAKVTASGAGNSCDSFAEVTSDHLIELMSAIPQFAKAGSAWYCGPVALETVFNAIKVGAGGNTADSLTQAQRPTFLGYPIEVSPVLPDSLTTDYTGLAMIGFGNLRMAATLGDRRGIRVALSNDRYWENDQIGIKGTMRHDINVHDMGSTTVKSPFAVLVGN
jgi:HK97 family phage major capsid protein